MNLLSKFDLSRAVGAYAAILTLGFAAFVLSGACAPQSAHFEQIDVQRINVREPDGILRMVISNHAKFLGLIMAKAEYAHPERTQGGMLFFNDEGAENGGLIFDGGLVNGKAMNGGSLSFDRYHQDQTPQLLSVEEGQTRFAGIYVNDQPDQPADFASSNRIQGMPDGPAKKAAFQNAHLGGQIQRAYLGRAADKSSQLVLRDGKGIKRLVLNVAEGGDPVIQFLDPSGKVLRTIQ